MDIAAISTLLAQGNVRANASVAVASKVKDMMELNGAQLVELMKTMSVLENSVTPHIGGNIDIKL
jgi:hypothetical protein